MPKLSIFGFFFRRKGSTKSTQARQLQLEGSSRDDGSNNGVQADNGAGLPDPKEKELARAIENLKAERSLVEQTQELLLQEQEGRRKVTEQLAFATKMVGQTQESCDHTKERLAEETEQKRKVDEQLRTVEVLRLSDRQEKEELEADRDRYKAIVQDMTSKRLLAGGTNIQATFPTLLEVQADIRRTLTVSVSEWVEDASPELLPGITLQKLLTKLFSSCQDEVERYHGNFKTFFFGGAVAAYEGLEPNMDEATATFMRQHMRRHYRTLFPVADTPLQEVSRVVMARLAGDADPEAGIRHLVATGLETVIKEYLLILVGALLQHPPVEFANDCATEDVFDPKIHAESIDGDDVGAGDKCIVVFPALMADDRGGEGLQPLNKKYILPLLGV